MKIIKRAAAIVLCVALALSMAACGSSDKAKDDAEVPKTESGQGHAEKDVTFPLKEPVKLSVFIPQGSDVCDIPENVVFQELQKATNIEFDLHIVPSVDAGEKLNMLLASGEYPEVIMGSTLSNQDLERYGVNEKILVPLNDLIEKYCPNIRQRLEENPNWKDETINEQK